MNDQKYCEMNDQEYCEMVYQEQKKVIIESALLLFAQDKINAYECGLISSFEMKKIPFDRREQIKNMLTFY